MKHLLVLSIMLSSLLTLNGCGEGDPDIPEMNTDSISYLALGDSYTIGQGVDESLRWPVQLSDKLGNSNIDITELEIIAQTGWTTGDLLAAIEAKQPQSCDLISLLIGVNNQYQNRSFEEFRIQFNSLLSIAVNLTTSEGKVFVVSIPDYGVTPFGSANAGIIAEQLDMYNEYMEKVCSDENISFVNITDISRELGNGEGALALDNLHPSGEQYSMWVDRILPEVKKLLN